MPVCAFACRARTLRSGWVLAQGRSRTGSAAGAGRTGSSGRPSAGRLGYKGGFAPSNSTRNGPPDMFARTGQKFLQTAARVIPATPQTPLRRPTGFEAQRSVHTGSLGTAAIAVHTIIRGRGGGSSFILARLGPRCASFHSPQPGLVPIQYPTCRRHWH